MPRNGILSSEEKARAVLCRTGRPGNECAAMTEGEIEQLAAIYDECIAPEAKLAQKIGEFWGDRQQRMDAAKATDDVGPEAKGLFRNSKRAKAIAAEPSAESPTAG